MILQMFTVFSRHRYIIRYKYNLHGQWKKTRKLPQTSKRKKAQETSASNQDEGKGPGFNLPT